ncbi:alpha/beta hydrolase [Nocardioides sp.]|uniref:alpha/beta hydrolase n=1 Tax=Nocardioides sp. TaxID=35761 RepID=UPI002B279288|nr:alpha/beta hydrolase [Nocardioides sp.]
MSGERREVSFESGGDTCAAWHYAPGESEQGPGNTWVVMAHGFSLTRHDGLAPFAEAFAAAGADVLVFDHRFLGDSGGRPRQRVRLGEQREDWRNAVDHARQCGARTVVVWGFSMSGSHAFQTALADPSIDAVLALAPFLDGYRRALSGDPAVTARIVVRAVAALAGSRVTIPVTAAVGDLGAMALEGEADGFAAVVSADSPWRNEVSPALFAPIVTHRPWKQAEGLTCPAWFGVGGRDISVHGPAIEAAADQAPQGRLQRYPQHDHWTPFQDGAQVAIAADQVTFLREQRLL